MARTLVDLAAPPTPAALARACHEADVLQDVTADDVDNVLARRPNSRGAARLRAVMHGDVPVAISRLETRFLTTLRRAGLPLPETNRVAGGRRVDARWPDLRLTVEVDGYRFHRSRYAWELDRAREREAGARGDDFRQYTCGDVCERPAAMLAELDALLRAPAS